MTSQIVEDFSSRQIPHVCISCTKTNTSIPAHLLLSNFKIKRVARENLHK